MYILGDTHGNNNYMKHVINDKDIRDTTIIHVGDFGVGFINTKQEQKNLEDLNEWLKERNIVLACCRGNHDDPSYFDGSFMFTNLKLYKDYTVITVEGKNILLVGGAISIDRVQRKREELMYTNNPNLPNKLYWSDEVFVLDKEKLEEFRDIDIVVTHTAPHFANPVNVNGNWPPIISQFMKGGDPTLGRELIDERAKLTEMYNILIKNNKNIQYYFYGHFHQHNVETFDNCFFICLNIYQFYKI